MERHIKSISRFGRAACALANIAIIALAVSGALALAAWIASGSSLPTEVVSIGGADVEVAYLFKIGGARVALPIEWASGLDSLWPRSPFPGFGGVAGFGDILGIAAAIVALCFAKRVFALLRADGSPFRRDIVRALKSLAIALLVAGGVSGAVPLIASGVVWMLRLIFDYGLALQSESDATL